MRKRNFSFALDNLLWWIIYLLPIFGYLITLSSGILVDNGSYIYPLSFGEFLNSVNFVQILSGNIIHSTLLSIFGSNGIVPIFFDGSSFLLYFSYFVGVYFIHLCVDVIMLLPRLVMHAMDKFGGEC